MDKNMIQYVMDKRELKIKMRGILTSILIKEGQQFCGSVLGMSRNLDLEIGATNKEFVYYILDFMANKLLDFSKLMY